MAQLTGGPTRGEPAGDPQRIGPYQLAEQIGEGGFGVVYRAEQHEPIRREVALKLIKPGMDSRQIIRRFEAERQSLALMKHPNIAAVLDAGSTPEGRPYFVMEWVRGEPITDYCDKKQFSISQRLELFTAVCQAVQHAHQKAILHRDLKPSNILIAEVDGKPVPKVIDFGIAKALGEEADAGHTLELTIAGGVVGTPEYMSPEQAGSTPDLDTRSDIYALGVILYELLTGHTPLGRRQARTAPIDEVLRQIREQEPCKPSTRVGMRDDGKADAVTTTLADTRRLARSLRGDLDWIVMKALEKDRNRRYATAAALAEDIRHFLRQEPVSAGAPSTAYRLTKFVRRNRVSLAAAAVVAMSLLGAAGVSMWRWREALLNRERIAMEKSRGDQYRDLGQQAVDHTVDQSAQLASANDMVLSLLPFADPELKPIAAKWTSTAKINQSKAGNISQSFGMFRMEAGVRARTPGEIEIDHAKDELLTAAAWIRSVLSAPAECRPFKGDGLPQERNPSVNGEIVSARKRLIDTPRERLIDTPLKRFELGLACLGVARAIESPVCVQVRFGGNNKPGLLRDRVSEHGGPVELEEWLQPDNDPVVWRLRAQYLLLGLLFEDGHNDPYGVKDLTGDVALEGAENPETLLLFMPKMAAKVSHNDTAMPGRAEKPSIVRDLLEWNGKKLQTAIILENDNDLNAFLLRYIFDTRCPESWLVKRGKPLPDNDDSEARNRKESGRHQVAMPEGDQLESDAMQEVPPTDQPNESVGSHSFNDDLSAALKQLAANPMNSELATKVAIYQAWLGKDAEYAAACRQFLTITADSKIPVLAQRAATLCCIKPFADPADRGRATLLIRRAAKWSYGDPRLPWCHLALGMAEFRGGNDDAAVAALTAVWQSASDHGVLLGTAKVYHAMCLLRQKHREAAVKKLREAEKLMRPVPKDDKEPFANGGTHEDLVLWLAYCEALAMFESAGIPRQHAQPNEAGNRPSFEDELALSVKHLEENPANSELAMKVGIYQAWQGNDADYAASCRNFLTIVTETKDPALAERAAKLCCIKPSADAAEREHAMVLARRAVELGKDQKFLPWYNLALGMAEFRGDHDDAAVAAFDAVEKSGFGHPPPAGHGESLPRHVPAAAETSGSGQGKTARG